MGGGFCVPSFPKTRANVPRVRARKRVRWSAHAFPALSQLHIARDNTAHVTVCVYPSVYVFTVFTHCKHSVNSKTAGHRLVFTRLRFFEGKGKLYIDSIFILYFALRKCVTRKHRRSNGGTLCYAFLKAKTRVQMFDKTRRYVRMCAYNLYVQSAHIHEIGENK